jgi:ATP-dependent RNA helicase RhlE
VRREPASRAEPARRSAPADPFFDRPYEPSVGGAEAAPAAWEPVAKATTPGRSPNIRAKKKVAALLGGSKA